MEPSLSLEDPPLVECSRPAADQLDWEAWVWEVAFADHRGRAPLVVAAAVVVAVAEAAG